MKTLLTLVVTFFLLSCTQAQEKKSGPFIGSIKEDIRILLPEGQNEVDIMDQVVMDPKAQMLMQKLQAAVQKDPEWFLEHQKTASPGQPLPYDERFGLSKDEYDEFLALSKNPNRMKMAKSSTESVTIIYDQDIVIFEGTGKLKVLNDLAINMQNSDAKLGDFVMSTPEYVKITSNDNGLGSKWKGYTWQYESANKDIEELTSVADYQDLQMKLYKVTIGRLESTGKTFLQIKISEIEDGQKVVNVDLPLIFK